MKSIEKDKKNFERDLFWMGRVKREFFRGIIIGLILIGIIIISLLVLIPSHMTKDYQKGFNVGYERASINFNPEVINGNLYIGYEDGKRIGYHYWNETWYRNGIEIETLEVQER